jgi:hypothetical protein
MKNVNAVSVGKVDGLANAFSLECCFARPTVLASANHGNQNKTTYPTLRALAKPRSTLPTPTALTFFLWSFTQGCSNPGLKLANACGVQSGLKLANACGVQSALKLVNAFGVQLGHPMMSVVS